jgi:hypothetical protein
MWIRKSKFRLCGNVSSTCYKSSPETELVLGQILTLMDQIKTRIAKATHSLPNLKRRENRNLFYFQNVMEIRKNVSGQNLEKMLRQKVVA